MKTKSKKAIAAVIGILVAALLACSVLLVQYVKEDLAPQVPEASAPAENGGMLIGEGEGAGVSLLSEKIEKADYEAYGVSPLAESAYTLTATVEPANAPDKAVDWSVAFVNPSSEWATGKTVTDYVTVTPTSDGALTATVQNLKAFGEQIKVTVTHRENENATASCTVDYTKKFISCDVVLKDLVTEEERSFTFGDESFISFVYKILSDGQSTTYSFHYGEDYTIDDEFTLTVEAQLNPVILEALKSDYPSLSANRWNKLTATEWITFTWDNENQRFYNQKWGNSGQAADLFQLSVAGMNLAMFRTSDDYPTSFNNEFFEQENAFISIMKENLTEHFFTAKIRAVGTYSTYEAETKINVTRSELQEYITGISLDDTSIIF